MSGIYLSEPQEKHLAGILEKEQIIATVERGHGFNSCYLSLAVVYIQQPDETIDRWIMNSAWFYFSDEARRRVLEHGVEPMYTVKTNVSDEDIMLDAIDYRDALQTVSMPRLCGKNAARYIVKCSAAIMR